MSKQNTNELLSDAKKFIELFHQVFEADFKYKNILRDMKILPGIYSIPVNINTYALAYSWLIHDRNKLFESLQIDHENLIRYTNVNIPKISKRIKKLNKQKLKRSSLSVLEQKNK